MVMLQRWKSLMKGEWFRYRGSLFNGGGLVMLERWLVLWRENIHATGGGHFNGGRMVTLQVTLMEGKWSCCRGG